MHRRTASTPDLEWAHVLDIMAIEHREAQRRVAQRLEEERRARDEHDEWRDRVLRD